MDTYEYISLTGDMLLLGNQALGLSKRAPGAEAENAGCKALCYY